MEFQIGSTVGDYEIVSILGAGGMGKVYKVRNLISDRIEAMKVLLPDLVNQPELADRFLREIKVQASLEHPNIAALHTAQRVDNQLLMLMEFVEGITLDQKLKEGPLPVDQAIDYFAQVLAALDYAHQHGVIHRDIKPANMMLTPSGAVKLMDFGIAKGAGDHRLTMTGATMGSLYYMSPEQIKGAAHIDSRADLYSAGVSLYELVTGKRPFDGDSQFAIMSAHLEKAPVPPVEVDPRLPQGLNDAILISVAKDPAMRFQTAGAFRTALLSTLPSKQAAASAATTVPAPPPVITQPVGPPAPPQAPPIAAPVATAKPGSKRGLWMAVGALAAALGAVAVIQFAPWRGTQARTPAIQPQPQPSQPAAITPTAPPPSAAAPSQPAAQPPAAEVTSPTPLKSKSPAKAAATQPSPGATHIPAPQPAVNPPVTASQAPVNPPQQAAQPPAQQPVPQLQQQQPQQAPAQPAGPSRAELQAAREHFAQLDARATGIRGSLQTLQRSQAASGLNLSSRFTGPASLMDSFMRGASDALRANDLDPAKDLMTKAERQIDILEKLLNR